MILKQCEVNINFKIISWMIILIKYTFICFALMK